MEADLSLRLASFGTTTNARVAMRDVFSDTQGGLVILQSHVRIKLDGMWRKVCTENRTRALLL